jgi:hypothetical protein
VIRRALPLLLGLLLTTPARAAEIEAQVGRGTFMLGESTPLEITVRGSGGVSDPEFDVPEGLEVLSSGKTQNFSWVNGKSTTETVFRYEIAGNRAGTFTIGPIRVKIGGQIYQSSAIHVTVGSERTRLGHGGDGPASLLVDTVPHEPFVGQPVMMRVRLIQRTTLSEDPRYAPPPTPGFWAERPSEPESYYADQSMSRVLVTETRTRLYPLSAGAAHIGSAVAGLTLATSSGMSDPLQWFNRHPSQREVEVQSTPVTVHVRPLPAGAPREFDGAVGSYSVTWSADRGRTTVDVPITVRLEVRGIGNVPLLHTPDLRAKDFEVFASSIDDSLSPPGSMSSGRRRFQWTVLARRQGRLEFPGPDFSWFDPGSAIYYRADLAPVMLEVGPPSGAGSPSRDAFPTAFARHPLDPARRPAQPWAWALAGLMTGFALIVWRNTGRASPDMAVRAQQREWLQAIGRGDGPDFWSAADRACEWLAGPGRPVHGLRREIESSRYGGHRVDAESVRAKLVENLTHVLAPPTPAWIPRTGAIVLVVLAAITCVWFGPHAGASGPVLRARAADDVARRGDVERARSGWSALWREGARDPGLAARMAWSEVRAGSIGPAALWVLRGDREEARDPAMSWVIDQIRETGGLAGFSPSRLPVRRLEWALLALMLGIAAGALWPRRVVAAAAAALAVACAAADPIQAAMAEHVPRAIVRTTTRLEGTDIELDPGQVVTVRSASGAKVRVTAGRGVDGTVPAGAIETLGSKR